MPTPPPGFELDAPAAGIPAGQPLPPGFELDEPSRAPTEEPGILDKVSKSVTNLPGGKAIAAAPEAVASLVTGSIAAPIAGLAGIAQGAYNLVTGNDDRTAADVVNGVSEAMTYHPRSEGGKDVMSVAALPDKAFNYAGEKAQQGATAVGLSPELAGIVGSAVKTAPYAVMTALGMKAGKAAEVSPAEALRQTLAEPTARAQQAAQSAGIDWARLGRQARQRLVEVAKNADDLTGLDADAIRRIAKAESLPSPVKLTRGQAERSPSLLRAEENLAQTDVGKPLNERHMDQDAALQQSLDILEGRTGKRAKDVTQTGQSVDTALQRRAQQSETRVDAAYKKARKAGDMEDNVSVKPLLDFVDDPKNFHAPGKFDFITKNLERLGAIYREDNGNWVETGKGISLNVAEDLRRIASRESRKDGSYWDAVKVIDNDMMSGDVGGALYKQARAERIRHAQEFENPRAIKNLIEDKKNTSDRITPVEKVFKAAITGSEEDLMRVRDTLLKKGDRRTVKAGRKAWKDLAGQTVEYIKTEAKKSAVTDRRGNVHLSADKLKKTLDSVGRRKLEILLGEGITDQLYRIRDVASDTKTMPPYRGGSTTAINAASLLDRVLGKVTHAPYIGGTARLAVGAAKLLKDTSKSVEEGNAVQSALAEPVAPYKPGFITSAPRKRATFSLKAALGGTARDQQR